MLLNFSELWGCFQLIKFKSLDDQKDAIYSWCASCGTPSKLLSLRQDKFSPSTVWLLRLCEAQEENLRGQTTFLWRCYQVVSLKPSCLLDNWFRVHVFKAASHYIECAYLYMLLQMHRFFLARFLGLLLIVIFGVFFKEALCFVLLLNMLFLL